MTGCKVSQSTARLRGEFLAPGVFVFVFVWLEWTKEDIEMNGKEVGWGERKSQGEPHCLADDVGQAGSLRA